MIFCGCCNHPPTEHRSLGRWNPNADIKFAVLVQDEGLNESSKNVARDSEKESLAGEEAENRPETSWPKTSTTDSCTVSVKGKDREVEIKNDEQCKF